MGLLGSFEATLAPRETVRDAARGRWPRERVAGYARWTLSLDQEPPARSPAWAAAWRLLHRGTLMPASPFLERALAPLGARAAAGLRLAHWTQVAALYAPALPERAETDFAEHGLLSRAQARAVAGAALADFAELYGALARLHAETFETGLPLFVSTTGAARAGWTTAFVEPGAAAAPAPPPRPGRAPLDTGAADPAFFARRLFGVQGLRPGQRQALEAALTGRDAFVRLATGAGKSLVYQLAALLLPGTAVIVEPLVAIVDEQLAALREAGIAAGSAADLERLSSGRLPLCYVCPERFESGAFRAALGAAADESGVSFVAVDEAHCAAQWGHDFRPGYGALGARARRLCAGPDGEPALIALTGTAGGAAAREVPRALGLREPLEVRGPSARAELSFGVLRCGRGGHLAALSGLVGRRRSDGGASRLLVFCPNVDGALGAPQAASRLRLDWGLAAGVFTGRAPNGGDQAAWETAKRAAAGAFARGALDALCCTSAFGLGVDPPGVRLTVHLALPESLEAFFQEAGRAGRDGRPADCVLALHVRDERRALRLLQPRRPLESLREELARAPSFRRDDVDAALARHLGRFPGESAERGDLELVWRELGPWEGGRLAELALAGQSPAALERAVARFEAAGACVVRGRRGEAVLLELAHGSRADEALEGARRELAELYAGVEPARRRSLGRLVELALSPAPGRTFSEALAGLADDAPEQRDVLVDGAVPGAVLGHRAAARLVELARGLVERLGAL